MAVSIYFDGDCPFCSNYVRLLRIRETLGEPLLINVREDAKELDQLRSRGFDLDQGMAVNVDGQWYTGDKAVHILATLGTPSGAFNRLNRLLFSSAVLSKLAYPALRAGRNATLLLLGRRSLADCADANAPMTLFSAVWGVFAIVHAISYAFFFNSKLYATTILVGVLGFVLLLRPRDARVFAALTGTFAVDAWLQMPLGSNHTIIKNFLLLAMLLTAGWQWLRGGGARDFYNDFAPAGRVLLLVMYIFGIFHKINRDFLDPSVSCAVALWREMPAPLSYIDTPAMHILAIYGTFLTEGVILACLLFRRTRYFGIAAGIAFHSLLALSGYAMYVPFSTLTVALHLLFIDPKNAISIENSPPWRRLTTSCGSPKGLLLIVGWAALMTGLAWTGSYSQLAIVWFPSMLFIAWVCLRHGRSHAEAEGLASLLSSKNFLVNVVSILFFVNCAMPYLGLKTAQSINMFANLRLEAGISNHLLLRSAPGPFNYLDDVVTVTDSSGSAFLAYVRANDLHLTRYHLYDHLERNPSATATFESGDSRHLHQSASTLAAEIEATLHPRWVRNWFHFNPVDLTAPKPCALDR